MYVDGALVTSTTVSYSVVVNGDHVMYLGYDHHQLFRYLEGAVDEFMLWDERITDADVANLFNDGACHRSSY